MDSSTQNNSWTEIPKKSKQLQNVKFSASRRRTDLFGRDSKWEQIKQRSYKR